MQSLLKGVRPVPEIALGNHGTGRPVPSVVRGGLAGRCLNQFGATLRS